MTCVETKLKWTDEKFKRRVGTTKPVFFLLMLDILQAAYNGYQGIQEYHEWSLIPIKKSKKQELSKAEKAFTALAVKKEWMTKLVEDVNRAAIFRLRDSTRNLKIAALFVQCQLSPARTVIGS